MPELRTNSNDVITFLADNKIVFNKNDLSLITILTLIMLMGVFFYPQTHIFNRCFEENGNISKSVGDFS